MNAVRERARRGEGAAQNAAVEHSPAQQRIGRLGRDASSVHEMHHTLLPGALQGTTPQSLARMARHASEISRTGAASLLPARVTPGAIVRTSYTSDSGALAPRRTWADGRVAEMLWRVAFAAIWPACRKVLKLRDFLLLGSCARYRPAHSSYIWCHGLFPQPRLPYRGYGASSSTGPAACARRPIRGNSACS